MALLQGSLVNYAKENNMKTINERYSVIDFGRFDKDIKKANSEFSDGLGYSVRIQNAGIAPSTYLTAKINAKDTDFSEYEHCEQYGIIQTVYFNVICNTFNLNRNAYIVKKKPVTAEIKETEVADISIDVIKKSIDYISNILLGMSCDFASRIGKVNTELSTQGGIQENILNDMVNCFASLNSKINDIGKIQVQNMEYLKQISEGIQKINDKYNKPSAYIRK